MKRHYFLIQRKGLLYLSFVLFSVVAFHTSCTNNIPDHITAFGDDINYTTRTFQPYLGRNTYFQNILNIGNATEQPLDFKIVQVRNSFGEVVDDLSIPYPVKVWIEEYNGNEKSIEEIEQKRKIEYRPTLEILRRSGNINFWGVDRSSVITSSPNFGYTFDIEVSSPGGRKYFRDIRVQPLIERAYEPSVYSPDLGLALNSFFSPSRTVNLVGERTQNNIFSNEIQVYITKDIRNTNPGNTLSFSFLDSLNHYIDPMKFDETNFTHLVHGFNHRIENSKLVYDVSFPMPMTNRVTRYTNEDGSRARANFRYSRLNELNLLDEALLGMDFAIYEEGHWEIQFRFRGERPKFEN